MSKSQSAHHTQNRLQKAKNVREQRRAVFGTDPNAPRISKGRMKIMQALRDFVKKRHGLDMVIAQGKRDESGQIRTDKRAESPYDVYSEKGHAAERKLAQIIAKMNQKRRAEGKIDVRRTDPKPDWRSGQLETQPTPDAAAHEIAHMYYEKPGQSLAEMQTRMDADWGDSQKRFGHLKQKQTQGEIQPMSLENPIRRRAGVPTTAPFKNPKPMSEHDRPVDQAIDQSGPRFIRGVKVKGDQPISVDYDRSARLMNEDVRRKLDMIDRGELVFDPKAGWVTGTSPDAKINIRAREISEDPNPETYFARKDKDTLMRSLGKSSPSTRAMKETLKRMKRRALGKSEDLAKQTPMSAAAGSIRSAFGMPSADTAAPPPPPPTPTPTGGSLGSSIAGAVGRIMGKSDEPVHHTAGQKEAWTRYKTAIDSGDEREQNIAAAHYRAESEKAAGAKQPKYNERPLKVAKSDCGPRLELLRKLAALAKMCKTNVVHPPESAEDKAHDVIEEGQSVKSALSELNPEEQRRMLEHVESAKQDPRSNINQAKGADKHGVIGKSEKWPVPGMVPPSGDKGKGGQLSKNVDQHRIKAHGERVVGSWTTNGKPTLLYNRADHPAHKDFTPYDHMRAAAYHSKKAKQYDGGNEYLRAAHHRKQSAAHRSQYEHLRNDPTHANSIYKSVMDAVRTKGASPMRETLNTGEPTSLEKNNDGKINTQRLLRIVKKLTDGKRPQQGEPPYIDAEFKNKLDGILKKAQYAKTGDPEDRKKALKEEKIKSDAMKRLGEKLRADTIKYLKNQKGEALASENPGSKERAKSSRRNLKDLEPGEQLNKPE